MLLLPLISFTPRLSQFFLPTSGYMVVPAGGGGTFLGGYIVKSLNLRCRGIIRFCMMCAMVSLLAIFIFLTHCPNVPMAGVTAPYRPLAEQHPLDKYSIAGKVQLSNRYEAGMRPSRSTCSIYRASVAHSHSLSQLSLEAR